MEEKILEIIQKNAAGSTEYITDGLYHEIAVKDIVDHFKEFIEWTILEADIDFSKNRGYWHRGKWKTLDEV